MTQADSQPRRVWIDTDPAFGDPYGDCDDGFAIIALMNASNVDVCAVSSVFANTGVDNASAKCRYLLDTFYKEQAVPFHPGDDYPLQLNHHKKTADTRYIRRTDVSKALIEALTCLDDGRRLTIVAIGSLVNIATVVLTRPDLCARIAEVVIVAGRKAVDQQFVFGNDPARAFRDLNFDVDPGATIALLSAAVPVVLAGVEVARTMWINQDDLDRFERDGRPAVAYMASQCGDWMKLWKGLDKPDLPPLIKSFHPFDLFAAAWAIRRDWFAGSQRTACLRTATDDTELSRPDDAYKMYLVAPEETATATAYDPEACRAPWQVYYLQSTRDGFKKEITDLLLG